MLGKGGVKEPGRNETRGRNATGGKVGNWLYKWYAKGVGRGRKKGASDNKGHKTGGKGGTSVDN